MSIDAHVFCQYADDIRREVNGKITIVGIYQGAMFVYGGIPQTLPRITIVVDLMLKGKQDIKSLEFRVLWNEELLQSLPIPPEHLVEVNSELDSSFAGVPLTGRHIQAHVFIQPFNLATDGVLRVVADIDGEVIKGNGLRIQEAPPDAPPLL